MSTPKPGGPSPVPTPGCSCSHCRRLKEIQRSGPPDTKKQMGRVQQSATELGWKDGGSENPKDGKMYGYMRPAEYADREEREITGRTLPSCYKSMLGKTPNIKSGDTQAAGLYLTRVQSAIDKGGWTRGEWTRLYKLRNKWKARASGEDARFNIVGNRRGGLEPHEASMVKFKRITDEMRKILERSGHSNGD